MYNKCKKLIVLLFVFLCLVNQIIICHAQTKSFNYEKNVESNMEQAQQYLESIFQNIQEMLRVDGQKYYQLSPEVVDNLEIAAPYIIYKFSF